MWTMVFYCQFTFVEYEATKRSREGGVVAAGSDDTWEMLKLQSLWAAPLSSPLVHHPRKSAKAYLYLMLFSPVCNLQEHEVVRRRELERIFCRARGWEAFCFSTLGLYQPRSHKEQLWIIEDIPFVFGPPDLQKRQKWLPTAFCLESGRKMRL